MSVGYCVPCILVLQTIGGVHQWNVRLKDMATVLYVCKLQTEVENFLTETS